MKQTSVRAALLPAVFLAYTCGGDTTTTTPPPTESTRTSVFVHPGLINTRAELDFIKATVKEPPAIP